MKLSTPYATAGIVALALATLLSSTQAATNHTIQVMSMDLEGHMPMNVCAKHTELMEQELSKIFGDDDDGDDNEHQRTLATLDIPYKDAIIDIPRLVKVWFGNYKPECYWICKETGFYPGQCKKAIPASQCRITHRNLRKKSSNNNDKKMSQEGKETSDETKGNGKQVGKDACDIVKNAVRNKLKALSKTGNDTGLQHCAKGLLKAEVMECANGIID